MKKTVFIIIIVVAATALYLSKTEVSNKHLVKHKVTKTEIKINTLNTPNFKKKDRPKGDEKRYARLEKELRELEDKLNDLPDILHENSFTYIRFAIHEMYQINGPDFLESLEMCEYKLEPNPEVVANFYAKNSERIKRLIDKYGYMDLIDELLPENNPYRDERLNPKKKFIYNCRTDMTKIYISNEFRKLIETETN